jgi:hypothetical protein
MNSEKTLKYTPAQKKASQKYYDKIRDKKRDEYQQKKDELIKKSIERYNKIKDNEDFRKKKAEYMKQYNQKKKLIKSLDSVD